MKNRILLPQPFLPEFSFIPNSSNYSFLVFITTCLSIMLKSQFLINFSCYLLISLYENEAPALFCLSIFLLTHMWVHVPVCIFVCVCVFNLNS